MESLNVGRWLQDAAFLATGLTAVSLAYALELGPGWYGLTSLAVGAVYVGAVSPVSRPWAAHKDLGSFAIIALAMSVSVPVLAGSSVATVVTGVAACALLMILTRLSQSDSNVFPFLNQQDAEQSDSDRLVQNVTRGFPVYLAMLSLSAAFYATLESTAMIDLEDTLEPAWAFFVLALAVFVVGASMRWWWPQSRVHVYASASIVAASSAVVLIDQTGPTSLMLAILAILAMAGAFWERTHWPLLIAGVLGALAFMAAFSYLTPSYAYAPVGVCVFGIAAICFSGVQQSRLKGAAPTLLVIGIVCVLLAPVFSWANFVVTLDDDIPYTRWPSDPTLACQTVAAMCAVAAVAMQKHWRVPATDGVMAAYALLLAAAVWSWARFGQEYGSQPDHVVALHLTAMVAFVAIVRLTDTMSVRVPFDSDERPVEDSWWGRNRVTAALFFLAGCLALNVAFFYTLDVLGVDTAQGANVAWAFFGMACFEAALAVASRWSWPAISRYLYVAAIATSAFALFEADHMEGQALVLSLACSCIALAAAFWERESKAVMVAAIFGLGAVFAAQRYWEVDYAGVTLVISGLGVVVYVLKVLFAERSREWANALIITALGLAISAAVFAGVRLIYLGDEDWMVGQKNLVETGLYQAFVFAIFCCGLLMAIEAWRRQHLLGFASASVVLMSGLLLEIAHFQPDNPQAYSVPIGLYFLAAAFVASRLRVLPSDLSFWQERLFGLGPAIIMAPSFIQSLDGNAWGYGVILLAEALVFLGLAILERRIWLLTVAVAFVVSDGIHYAMFGEGGGEGGLPSWALLAVAGLMVMGAGTAILMGRDRWPDIQGSLMRWWSQERPAPE